MAKGPAVRGWLVLVLLLCVIGVGAWLGWENRRGIKNTVDQMLWKQQVNSMIQNGQTEAAMAELERRANASPPDADALARLVALLRELGRPDEAQAIAEAAAARTTDLRVKLVYAESLGRPDEALVVYREIIEQQGQLPPEDRLRLVNDLASVCQQSAEREPRRAIRRWLLDWAVYYRRLAVRQAPKRFATHFELARTYQALEQPADAILSGCRAVSLNPDAYAPRYNLALSLFAQGAFDQGQRQLDRALSLAREQANPAEAKALAERAQQARAHWLSGEPQRQSAPDIGKALSEACYINNSTPTN